MTMGWHLVMEFQPSLIGCYIWSANHSFEMIRRSKECVINIPEVKLASKVVDIGNTSGREIDKFDKFGLTAEQGEKVKAPLIAECFANYECKLVDARLINFLQRFIIGVMVFSCCRARIRRDTGHASSRRCFSSWNSSWLCRPRDSRSLGSSTGSRFRNRANAEHPINKSEVTK